MVVGAVAHGVPQAKMPNEFIRTCGRSVLRQIDRGGDWEAAIVWRKCSGNERFVVRRAITQRHIDRLAKKVAEPVAGLQALG